MLLINNTNINPYFNLAMEEYFLKNGILKTYDLVINYLIQNINNKISTLKD